MIGTTGPAGDIIIAGAARTPFGKFGGSLRSVPLAQLGGVAVGAALGRASMQPGAIDEIAFGTNFPASDRSIARQVALRAGIPPDRNAYSIDRACCSSLTAVTLATRGMRLGEVVTVVAGGTENLSMVPYFLPQLRWGHRLGDVPLRDVLVVSCPHTGVPRAVQASSQAAEYGVTREEQDAWAMRSQQLYAAARATRKFDDEIVEFRAWIDAEEVMLSEDESPRPSTTLGALAALPTVNGSSTVTAGNAPGLSTGSSAIVLAAKTSRSSEAPKLADLVVTAMVSGDPQHLGSMPAVAARRALCAANLSLAEIALLEINEAFAAVPLISTLVLADRDKVIAERLRERTNVNGGAIAIGHPTGATAARLLMTAAYELRRRGGGYGLIAICGGIGEAEAAIIRVD